MRKKIISIVFQAIDLVNEQNDQDELIKKNRLELLQMLCKTFDNYLNFSKVESF